MSNLNLELVDSAIALIEQPAVRKIMTDLRDEYEVGLFRIREMSYDDRAAPEEWGLTKMEERLVRALAAIAYPTNSQLMTEMYYDHPDGRVPKIIDVYICKVRKKLRPFGVTIKTRWAVGYYAEGESRRILREGFGMEGDRG